MIISILKGFLLLINTLKHTLFLFYIVFLNLIFIHLNYKQTKNIMKKLLFITLLSTILFACKKDEDTTTVSSNNNPTTSLECTGLIIENGDSLTATYNSKGLLEKMIPFNINSFSHEYVYDNSDKLIYYHVTTSGYKRSIEYKYNSQGQIISNTDGEGSSPYESFFTYDSNGYLKQAIWGNGSRMDTTTYEFKNDTVYRLITSNISPTYNYKSVYENQDNPLDGLYFSGANTVFTPYLVKNKVVYGINVNTNDEKFYTYTRDSNNRVTESEIKFYKNGSLNNTYTLSFTYCN